VSSLATSPESAEGGGQGHRKGWKVGRWIAASVILAILIILTLVSSLTPHLRVCDEIVAQVGAAPTVRTCRPLELTDLPVVLGLILIIGLVAPDFKRVSIAGVVELEREVREVGGQVENLAGKIEQLSISASSARASINYYERGLPPDVDIAVSDATLEEKTRRLEDLDESSEG
jgi:hypothetical protein